FLVAAVVAAVLALISGGLALWANKERIDANAAKKGEHEAAVKRREAELKAMVRLAAQSELVRSQRADLLPLSVLLAVESLQRFPSEEAERALRGGLALLPRPVARMTHEREVRDIAFGPDGKYVATACADKFARVWEAASGRPVAQMKHEQDVLAIAFSSKG